MKVFRALAIVFLISISWACAAMELKNEYFTINLSDQWKQKETGNPEQWVFESQEGQITLSVVAMNASKSDLERIANKLLEIRYDVEMKVRTNPAMTEPWGTEHPDGTLQINYMGRDDDKNYFFFSGYVMPQGTLSVTGELKNGSDEKIRELFQEVLLSLTF